MWDKKEIVGQQLKTEVWNRDITALVKNIRMAQSAMEESMLGLLLRDRIPNINIIYQ